MPADLTAIILTKDEEINIEDCIKSIKDITKRIIVIDSYSSDKTVFIAKSLGVEVYQHKFENHAKQFMYALETTDIDTVWTLRIDADERLTSESSKELMDLCNEHMNTQVSGIVLRFKKSFLGKDLRHGGVYPWKKLSCFKTKFGTVEERLMDEHIVVREGYVVTMTNDCLHFDFKSLDSFIAKHNWYSTREVIDYYNNLENPDLTNMSAKTKFKMRVYYKLPGGLRSFIYYFYRYYIRMGFLDGREGRIYAFLQAYWYRYLVDAKMYECKKMGVVYQTDGTLKKEE